MKYFTQKLSLLSGVALLLFVANWSSASYLPALAQQSGSNPPSRTISVSGNGMVSIRPDVAVITVGVQSEATDASAALNQNNTQMQAVIDALQASGVISDDIQTQTLQLQPQMPVPPTDQPRPLEQTTETMTSTSYIASNLVEIRVRDLTGVGELLDSIVQAGGNRIQGIRFEVSDASAALDEARQMAWNNAKSTAEKLAQLAGVSLGTVTMISEFSSSPVASAMVADARLDQSNVPMAPGTQQVTVNLQVIWQLAE